MTLRQCLHGIFLSVIDDGVGFKMSATRKGHFGLRIMAERAQAIGGRLRIRSRLGKGTTVTLFLPFTAFRSKEAVTSWQAA